MMKQDRADGTIAPGLVVGGLGFLALVAQTLLSYLDHVADEASMRRSRYGYA